MNLAAPIQFLLPGLAEHYRILKKLRVASKLDLLKILLLTSLTVFFEAWGIAMVLPIISFLRNDSDPEKFGASSQFGQYIVEAFSAVGLPLHLLTLCSVVILMIAIRQALNYLQTLHVDRMKLRIGRDLSIKCYSSILGSKPENIETYRSGQFSTLVQHECQAAASVVRNYSRIWSLILTFTIYISFMIVVEPVASIGAIALIGGVIMSMGKFIEITRKLASRRVRVRANFISYLSERFLAWRLIKTADALSFETEKAREHAQRDYDTEYAVTRVGGLVQLILTPVVMFVTLFALYFSVEYMHIEVDRIAVFMLILLRLVPVGQNLHGQRNLLASFDPSLRLVERTLDQAEANKESLGTGRDVPPLKQGIDFENVSFSYPGESALVLKNISTTIPAGKMTAIIGHSGAGKSTLSDVLLRLYDPSEGRVLYDGQPIGEFNLSAYRNNLACVSQESLVFDDTVANNIRYMRRDASQEMVEKAAIHAHAHEFIEKLPEGYDTFIGEKGARLSGGEKQRIALARTFLSGARIVVLDEPTSALDYASERKVQEAIEGFVRELGMTVIVIAHRLSTIQNADLVLHLSNGELIHQGRPNEVLPLLSNADNSWEYNAAPLRSGSE